jgi:hypothetical protein
MNNVQSVTFKAKDGYSLAGKLYIPSKTPHAVLLNYKDSHRNVLENLNCGLCKLNLMMGQRKKQDLPLYIN